MTSDPSRRSSDESRGEADDPDRSSRAAWEASGFRGADAPDVPVRDFPYLPLNESSLYPPTLRRRLLEEVTSQSTTRHDGQSLEETTSDAVLTAVARREAVSKHELPVPLFEAVDPEALDVLFRNTRGELSFEYLGYAVTVDHRQNVDVTALGATSDR